MLTLLTNYNIILAEHNPSLQTESIIECACADSVNHFSKNKPDDIV